MIRAATRPRHRGIAVFRVARQTPTESLAATDRLIHLGVGRRPMSCGSWGSPWSVSVDRPQLTSPYGSAGALWSPKIRVRRSLRRSRATGRS
jgi:hypothetical protein